MSLCPVWRHATLEPCRFLSGYVVVTEDYPRPAPTTIHFSGRAWSYFSLVYTLVHSFPFGRMCRVFVSAWGRSAVQVTAPCMNSFVHSYACLDFIRKSDKATIYGNTLPAPRISALTPNRMYARGQLSDGDTAEFIFRLYVCLHEISHILPDQFGSLPFARLSTKIYLSRGSSNYLLEASFVLVRYKIIHWIFTSCIIFNWISQCQILFCSTW